MRVSKKFSVAVATNGPDFIPKERDVIRRCWFRPANAAKKPETGAFHVKTLSIVRQWDCRHYLWGIACTSRLFYL